MYSGLDFAERPESERYIIIRKGISMGTLLANVSWVTSTAKVYGWLK